MKNLFQPLCLAGLMVVISSVAQAQSPVTVAESAPAATASMPGHGMDLRQRMHEGMNEARGTWAHYRMDRHLSELKTQLKLSPAQESSWTAFAAAMKPSADMRSARPDPAELQKLSTPERLDRMKLLREQHHAAMMTAHDQREQAVRNFYGVLTPEQKMLFDAQTLGYHRAYHHRGG